MLDNFFRWLGPLIMNKKNDYEETYFLRNHLRWLRSPLGQIFRLYYIYVAKYAMADVVSLPKGSRILDIGCGVGTLVDSFHKLGYKATGVDVNSQAITNNIAKKHCLLVKNTNKLDFNNRYFNLVVSREVLEHIPLKDIDSCITEWDRVSRGQMVHIIAVKERGPSAENDPAHCNVQTEQWWVNKFKKHGYSAQLQPFKWFLSPFGSKGYIRFTKN